MRTLKRTFVVIALAVFTLTSTFAQEFSTGLDIYSSYIWRGTKFGSGPAFQPAVDFTTGGLSIGAWGSVNASADEAMEMDLYLGYSFDFGLSVTLTDYYFGGDWMDGDSHFLEPMVSYSTGALNLTAAYMLYPGSPAIDATDGEAAVAATSFGDVADLYFEAAYAFESFDITLGAGDGAYTVDGEFAVCNIGIGTSKEIKITDSFSLPVSGAVILNPSTGGFFITVGLSL